MHADALPFATTSCFAAGITLLLMPNTPNAGLEPLRKATSGAGVSVPSSAKNKAASGHAHSGSKEEDRWRSLEKHPTWHRSLSSYTWSPVMKKTKRLRVLLAVVVGHTLHSS